MVKVLLNSRSIGFKKVLTKNLHRLNNYKTEQSYKQMQVLYIHTHPSYNKPGTGDIIELIMSRKSGGCCGRSCAHCLPLLDRPWCDRAPPLYGRLPTARDGQDAGDEMIGSGLGLRCVWLAPRYATQAHIPPNRPNNGIHGPTVLNLTASSLYM